MTVQREHDWRCVSRLLLPPSAKKKCFSPARWGSAMTSGKLIRASSFYTSNINVLLSYVAIVSRPRYVWGMENNSADTGPEQPRRRRHRSAVSNGNRLFTVEPLDGRTHMAMRFRDLNDDIIADLGGRDRLSTGQLQLVRRVATLSVTAEGMEADAVSGKAFDVDLYGQLTDRLGRCLQRLGLERRARDVTPHQAQPPSKIQETLELLRSRLNDIKKAKAT